jgi:exodeoxyribonuclease-3
VRLVSANVNGIRAAARRGGLAWLAEQGPDVLCLQEVRASDAQLAEVLGEGGFGDWHVAHTEAPAKGRAGVAVVSRTPQLRVQTGVGPAEFDGVGRWVEVDLETPRGAVTVVSTYVHTGEAGTGRQAEKYRFLDAVTERLDSWAGDGAMAVVTGDLNVAHQEHDLKNWKGNLAKSGFLPQERAYFDRWFANGQWVDVHRTLHGPGRARTRGGRGAARRSTTMPAGASTTSSRACPSQGWRRPRVPAARRHTTFGGATTRR